MLTTFRVGVEHAPTLTSGYRIPSSLPSPWRYRASSLHACCMLTSRRTPIPSTSSIKVTWHRHYSSLSSSLYTMITFTSLLYRSYSCSPASQVSDINLLFTSLFLVILLPSKLIAHLPNSLILAPKFFLRGMTESPPQRREIQYSKTL